MTSYHADKPNFPEFWVKMAKMTLKVKVNDPYFQYQLRVSHDACLVQIWWFQLKSVTSYHADKVNLMDGPTDRLYERCLLCLASDNRDHIKLSTSRSTEITWWDNYRNDCSGHRICVTKWKNKFITEGTNEWTSRQEKKYSRIPLSRVPLTRYNQLVALAPWTPNFSDAPLATTHMTDPATHMCWSEQISPLANSSHATWQPFNLSHCIELHNCIEIHNTHLLGCAGQLSQTCLTHLVQF